MPVIPDESRRQLLSELQDLEQLLQIEKDIITAIRPLKRAKRSRAEILHLRAAADLQIRIDTYRHILECLKLREGEGEHGPEETN